MKKLFYILCAASLFAFAACNDNDASFPTDNEQENTKPDTNNNSGENNSGENGSSENNSGENGSGENNSGENGSGENGSGENNSGENGSGENNSGENNSGDVEPPSEPYVPITINEIPEGQDITEGNSCKVVNFVDTCNGTSIVYCKIGKVRYEDCALSGQKCAIALNEDGTNYADCIATDDSDICTVENKITSACEKDYDNGYEVSQGYKCRRFNDGKLHLGYADSNYCGNLCADGCSTPAKCDGSTIDKCVGNVAYICDLYREEIYVKQCDNACTVTGNTAVCK